MVERFRLVETNWSRSFGPEASGLEFQHWSRNFGIIQFVHSWRKAKSCQHTAISNQPFLVYFSKLPSREGLGVCIISCKLTVDSLQWFLSYKSKFIPKFRDKNR